MLVSKRQLKRYIDRKIRDGILESIRGVVTPDRLLTAGWIIAPGAIAYAAVRLIRFLANRSLTKGILDGSVSEGEWLDQMKSILFESKEIRNNPKAKDAIYKVRTINGMIALAKKLGFGNDVMSELLEKKALFAQAKR